MSDLSSMEVELLGRLRRSLGPSAHDETRVASLLAARLALGAAAAPVEIDPTPGASDGIAHALFGSSVRQLATGSVIAALGFGAGYGTARIQGSPSPAPRAEAHAGSPHRVEAPRAPAARTPEAPLAAAPASVPSERTRPRSSPLPSAPAAEARDSASLSDEALELRRVDRALRGNSPLLALGILDDLDRRIPRGALREEREAARLMARCKLGDGAARAAAARWLERHPRSVYAPRLRTFCVEPDGE
jgi:hypothetical protein